MEPAGAMSSVLISRGGGLIRCSVGHLWLPGTMCVPGFPQPKRSAASQLVRPTDAVKWDYSTMIGLRKEGRERSAAHLRSPRRRRPG